MKKLICLLLNLAFVSAFAQAPQAIKYQAIARNTNGEIMLNQAISMRISILGESTTGTTLYAETHTVTTNAYGLVNLEIGRGTPVSGTFAGINWGKGNYFVKIEADENGGNNFSLLGISQLLSVPFALYANSAGVPGLTDEQRDALIDPAEGMIIYNLTSLCLNYRRNNSWFQVCGDCVPQPSVPDAGVDRIVCVDTAAVLNANTPLKGSGTWSIISGSGGIFSDVHNPMTTFTGNNYETYVLAWEIATACNSLTDQVSITFNYLPPANAGADQLLQGEYINTYLSANNPGPGHVGEWSIISGEAGILADIHDPATHFQGFAGTDYTLRWTTWSSCDTSYDEVNLSLCPPPVIANAGPDSISYTQSFILSANNPSPNGSGFWTIISGNGAVLSDTTSPNATLYGLTNTVYLLRWTLITSCDTSFDEVVIGFLDSGPESLFLVGASTPVGWNPGAALPFTKIGPGLFHIYVPLTVSVDGFKFLPTLGSWEGDWGQNPSAPGTIIQQGEEDCPVSQAGFYLISVDFVNMTYYAVITSWAILGSAIPPYDWNTDINMSYMGGSQPYTWEINNLAVQAGEFKFRANDGWEINFGDDGNNGSLEFMGQNIPVNAGNYNVKLILEPGNWTYTMTIIDTIISTCPSTVDYEGRTYNLVEIGSQCWFKENLNVGSLLGVAFEQTNNNVIEKYCFNNDTNYCNTYGGLYQWNELMQYTNTPGAQGICPLGFHLPTLAEWDTLLEYLGGGSVAAGKMKEIGYTHWTEPNTGATNESGFTALPAGDRSIYAEFNYINYRAYYWTSNEYDEFYSSWGRILYHDSETIYIGSLSRTLGLSARCLKD